MAYYVLTKLIDSYQLNVTHNIHIPPILQSAIHTANQIAYNIDKQTLGDWYKQVSEDDFKYFYSGIENMCYEAFSNVFMYFDAVDEGLGYFVDRKVYEKYLKDPKEFIKEYLNLYLENREKNADLI